MARDLGKRSAAAKQAWAKLTPAHREYRGLLVRIGHRHKKHIELGSRCDCEDVRREFIAQWRGLRRPA